MLNAEVVHAGSEHKALIADSWLRSMRRAPKYARCKDGEWHAVDHQTRRLLAESTCLVALDEVALGWIAGRRGADGRLRVHYVYVLSAFRRNGLARRLVNELAAATGAMLPGHYDLRMPPYTRGLEDAGWRLISREWRPE